MLFIDGALPVDRAGPAGAGSRIVPRLRTTSDQLKLSCVLRTRIESGSRHDQTVRHVRAQRGALALRTGNLEASRTVPEPGTKNRRRAVTRRIQQFEERA